MNIAFALDYIPRRMMELGYGLDYTTRYLHLRIEKGQTLVLRAYNQLMLLIVPESNIRIISSRGIFDSSDTTINIQQHEHSGKISITNKDRTANTLVLLIQVMPFNQKKKKP